MAARKLRAASETAVSGGYGAVYDVRDESGNLYLVKVAKNSNSEQVASFRREYELTKHANSKDPNHFVRVVGYMEESRANISALNGYPSIIEERIDGTPLSKTIANGHCLELDEGRRIALELLHGCLTLQSLGYIHHDLHPGNIIRAFDGRVLLVDLGSASPIAIDDENRVLNGYEPTSERNRPTGRPPQETYDAICIANVIRKACWGDYLSHGERIPKSKLYSWTERVINNEFSSLDSAYYSLEM